MCIFTKPDGVLSAPQEIQLCSYFSLFIALPTSKMSSIESNRSSNTSSYWSSEQILDATFIQDIVNNQVPKGISTKVKCWRMHFRHHSDKPSVEESVNWIKNDLSHAKATLVAEYKIAVFGVKLPIISKNVEKYKKSIEDEVGRMTKGTRKGAWSVSNIIPSSLLKL
mmetsp:Transcript_17992/g.26958  ORF Transcript_17992/g.26958 Transcript_17992/m.26958 type:complete len:167 (-) Transcript_17992:651-1151(-)